MSEQSLSGRLYSSYNFVRRSIFSLMAASLASYEENMEESDALETENEITPRSMSKIAPIFSDGVPPEISPYPTVVMVVIEK